MVSRGSLPPRSIRPTRPGDDGHAGLLPFAERVAELLPDLAEDRWLDSPAAADYLALSINALHKLTAEDRIPFCQDADGVLFSLSYSALPEPQRRVARAELGTTRSVVALASLVRRPSGARISRTLRLSCAQARIRTYVRSRDAGKHQGAGSRSCPHGAAQGGVEPAGRFDRGDGKRPRPPRATGGDRGPSPLRCRKRPG